MRDEKEIREMLNRKLEEEGKCAANIGIAKAVYLRDITLLRWVLGDE